MSDEYTDSDMLNQVYGELRTALDLGFLDGLGQTLAVGLVSKIEAHRDGRKWWLEKDVQA